MRLPQASAHYSKRVDFGDYVVRRLRRKRYLILADDLAQATELVLQAGRAYEDAERPVQAALADRDAADDDLDDIAKEARAKLAGRSADAARNPPYTKIYSQGIAYYTAAPIDQEERRYGELKQRMEEHLGVDDEVRKVAVPAIVTGIDEFGKAKAALNDTRTALAMAATRLEAAEEAWERQVEKTYGELVADGGRSQAERFFPRVSSKSSKKEK